jgi:hypothetical protein
METITELKAQEQQRIARAYRFEALTGEASTLRSKVAGLATATVDVSALKQIIELADAIPASVTTRGSGFIHGGYASRDVIKQAAVDALNHLTRQDAERIDAHKKAKTRLRVVEQELKEFD